MSNAKSPRQTGMCCIMGFAAWFCFGREAQRQTVRQTDSLRPAGIDHLDKEELFSQVVSTVFPSHLTETCEKLNQSPQAGPDPGI